MPGRDHTRIPRSSPPKPSATPLYSRTPHGNSPIPLCGTGKSVSRHNSPFRLTGGTDHSPLSLPTRLDASLSNSVTSAAQRMNGSRIPAASKLQGPGGSKLGISPLPTSTSGLRLALPQSSPALIRPSFHVPVIHSPTSKFVSATHSEYGSPDSSTHGGGGRPGEAIAMPPAEDVGDTPQGIAATPPSLIRTPTAASNMSSESQYTTRSAAELAQAHNITEAQNICATERYSEEGEEGHTANSMGDGIDCEAEDAVLSPGFDVIQALADNNKFQNMEHRTPSEYTPTTPRPLPFSRNISDLRKPIYDPPSASTIVGIHPVPPSPSARVLNPRPRSLAAEAANMMLRNPPTQFPLYSYEPQTLPTVNPKISSSHPPLHTSRNVCEIIQQIETLIGHPCVDREAVHAAQREARVHSEPGSCKFTSTCIPRRV